MYDSHRIWYLKQKYFQKIFYKTLGNTFSETSQPRVEFSTLFIENIHEADHNNTKIMIGTSQLKKQK